MTSKGGGKFSRGAALNIRWGSRFSPPKEKTTKIRIIPGNYRGFDGTDYEFFQYVSFFSGRTSRGFVSSGKWGMVDGNVTKIAGNCLGYDEWQSEIEQGIKKTERSVSMRIMHAYTVLHLEWYHETPALDENNRPKKYKNGKKAGEVIVDRVQCQGRRCDYCRDKVEKVFGKRLHWSMGVGHLMGLAGYIKEIGRDCVNCDGEGTIEDLTHDCSNCGRIIVDMDKYDMSVENDRNEVGSIISEPYACKCGTTEMLVCQQECSSCKDPMPQSIYDCDLEVKTVGENTQSTIQIPRWTRTELSKELQEMAKPFDFSEIFAGDPLDQQAKMLKVKNPYGSAENNDADKHSRGYDEEEKSSDDGDRRGRRSRVEKESDSANFKE